MDLRLAKLTCTNRNSILESHWPAAYFTPCARASCKHAQTVLTSVRTKSMSRDHHANISSENHPGQEPVTGNIKLPKLHRVSPATFADRLFDRRSLLPPRRPKQTPQVSPEACVFKFLTKHRPGFLRNLPRILLSDRNPPEFAQKLAFSVF